MPSLAREGHIIIHGNESRNFNLSGTSPVYILDPDLTINVPQDGLAPDSARPSSAQDD